MMEKRTTGRRQTGLFTFALMLLVLTANPLGALPNRVNPIGTSFDIDWYGSIPGQAHADPLPIRSHLAGNVVLTPFSLSLTPKVGLSGGLAMVFASRSLAYGTLSWRAFVGLGPVVDVTFDLGGFFSITEAIHFLCSFYTDAYDFSAILRLSTIGEFRLFMDSGRQNRLDLTVPLHVDIRADYVSVSAGIGLRWRYNRHPVMEETP
jgi:hypothetical protein